MAVAWVAVTPPTSPIPTAPAFDGVAVLAFDDMAGMEKAMATPEWEAVMDDVPKFVDDSRVVIMIVEENVVV